MPSEQEKRADKGKEPAKASPEDKGKNKEKLSEVDQIAETLRLNNVDTKDWASPGNPTVHRPSAHRKSMQINALTMTPIHQEGSRRMSAGSVALAASTPVDNAGSQGQHGGRPRRDTLTQGPSMFLGTDYRQLRQAQERLAQQAKDNDRWESDGDEAEENNSDGK